MANNRTRYAVAAVVMLVLVAWIALQARSRDAPLPHRASTTDYLPGVAADVYLPSPTTRAPVVVLIPGGSWQTANRSGLGPLAEGLAAHGMVVVNATYRAVKSGVRFPGPVADVVCAIDFAADRARQAGISAGPIIVLGHSSGAHLAALAALRGPHFRKDCPYPPAQVSGLIGLSGTYEVTQLQDLAQPLFGVPAGAAPALWHDGDPMGWVKERTAPPALPVLLAHGAADDLLSPTFTEVFAQALKDAGHPVQLEIVPGANHQSIYTPRVIANTVITWIGTLPRSS
jgi:acetyl esterase/lipase